MVAMVSYVVDNGLLVLRDQVDRMAPTRRKGSDGTKGDAAHAARTSKHNPEHPAPAGNPDFQVDALDLTHDPERGADMEVVTEQIRLSRDPRVNLVIFDHRMFSSYAHGGYPAWTWRPYDGADGHEGHAHIEVNDIHHDDTRPWSIGMDKSDEKALINRVNAMIDMAPVNPFGDSLKPEPNKLAEALNGIAADAKAGSETVGQVLAALKELVPLLMSILTRLEALEQGPAPTYTGTATLTLQSHAPEVADLLLGEMDRGGQ
jgi:hypothetical protein